MFNVAIGFRTGPTVNQSYWIPFQGSNSGIFMFALFLNRSQAFKERINLICISDFLIRAYIREAHI